MSRVICVPPALLPRRRRRADTYLSLYSATEHDDVGSIATGMLDVLRFKGCNPSIPAWDFLTFALAVGAADLAVLREQSADGWTRVIELEIALHDPSPFLARQAGIEEMLRFLTGDFWHLTFVRNGVPPPRSTAPTRFDADCVSLLSGGMDSLIGAIDLTEQGLRPLFVSQSVRGNLDDQHHIAAQVGGTSRHLLLNNNVRMTGPREISTRARSIIFYGYAALAVSALSGVSEATVYVPENGFISLNIPLTPGRIGSLSTRTTHPVFLGQLQQLWDGIGLAAKFESPYKHVTKGEAMLACRDIPLMNRLMPRTTSCGKFGRLNEHCGRCLPCLVRRAAFLKAGRRDPTRSYRYQDLRSSAPSGNTNDVNAAATAYLRFRSDGVESLIAGALSFASPDERPALARVVSHGLQEVGTFLEREGLV